MCILRTLKQLTYPIVNLDNLRVDIVIMVPSLQRLFQVDNSDTLRRQLQVSEDGAQDQIAMSVDEKLFLCITITQAKN